MKAIVYIRFIPILLLMRINSILDTWFRFLVKQLNYERNVNSPAHEWHEMAFFTNWSKPDLKAVFFFDAPQDLQCHVQRLLSSSPARLDSLDHYSMHVLIVEEIVNLFENSVWDLRDLIRRVEMVKFKSIPETGYQVTEAPSRVEPHPRHQSLTILCCMIPQDIRFTLQRRSTSR